MQAVVKKVVYSFRYRLGPGQVGREVFHIVLRGESIPTLHLKTCGQLFWRMSWQNKKRKVQWHTRNFDNFATVFFFFSIPLDTETLLQNFQHIFLGLRFLEKFSECVALHESGKEWAPHIGISFSHLDLKKYVKNFQRSLYHTCKFLWRCSVTNEPAPKDLYTFPTKNLVGRKKILFIQTNTLCWRKS